MTEITVITNNVPRHVVDGWELTAAERAEFDYVDWPAVDRGEGSASFVRYKGETYDLAEFMRWQHAAVTPMQAAWDGYMSDSFFSGVLVRYCDDMESVVVGRYCS